MSYELLGFLSERKLRRDISKSENEQRRNHRTVQASNPELRTRLQRGNFLFRTNRTSRQPFPAIRQHSHPEVPEIPRDFQSPQNRSRYLFVLCADLYFTVGLILVSTGAAYTPTDFLSVDLNVQVFAFIAVGITLFSTLMTFTLRNFAL